MSTLKAIPSDGYQVRPFITHKTQHYEVTYGGSSNPEEVHIDLAVMPPNIHEWDFDPDTAPKNSDGTYRGQLYSSLKHMFYSKASQWTEGVLKTIPTGSNLYVINAIQKSYGEGIYPGSFKLSVTGDTNYIADDGKGNLLIDGSTPTVGHIFYDFGLAVIKKGTGDVIDSTGLNLSNGTVVDIDFKATRTIYEHNIMCTMDVGDMAFTLNPSIKKTAGNGELVADLVASGSLPPYMTSVGLYNNENQLLAVAKFPRPIKRASESQQTVIIRFDV